MRKLFRTLHKWLSIPAGIIITITCLTGAIQVFQQELLELFYPSRYFVKEVKHTPIPLPELIPMLNAQLDTNLVASVKIFSDMNRTYTVNLQKGFRMSAFVNQYTGEVISVHEYKKGFFFNIMALHRWLMDGSRTWGKYTVGISTLMFVFILISGFIIWIPRKLRKNHFKIEYRKGNRRLLYDLHSVLGFYACLILLICALTGLMWSFDWYKNPVLSLLGANTPQQEIKKEKKERQELNTANWQLAIDNTKNANPRFEYLQIQDGVINVHQSNAMLSRAIDKCVFDPATGEITKTIPFAEQEKSTKVWAWVYSLHTGNYWGIFSKIFTFIFAIIGASLPITGYYLFFIKKR